MRNFFTVTALAVLAGCATQPKMAEFGAGSKMIRFYQRGTEPLAYRFGVVDGKSFWAGARTERGGTGLVGVLGDSAQAAAEAEQATARDILRKMSGNLSYVDQLTRELIPAIAGKLGAGSEAEKVKTIDAEAALEDADGYFSPGHSGEDLAVVVEVSELRLTEQPSVGGLFAAMFTAGLNEKKVAPDLWAKVRIYKRQDGRLKRNWEGRCGVSVLMAPEGQYFSELKQNPAQGNEMFKNALPVLLKMCSEMVARA